MVGKLECKAMSKKDKGSKRKQSQVEGKSKADLDIRLNHEHGDVNPSVDPSVDQLH